MKIYEGRLYEMICDNICDDFLKRENITYISLRRNDVGEEWILVITNIGQKILLESYDIRRYQLKILIDKIKNPLK